jgi:hypothetical protein
MKSTQLEHKLKTLKEIIKNINTNAVNLIHSSAEIELEIRNSSGNKTSNIESKIDKLIKKYQNYIK